MSKRAKVVFTDGFLVSPTIETDQKNLRERIRRVVRQGHQTPALASSAFVVVSFAGEHPVALLNTPEGRSLGSVRASVERPEFWPGGPDAGQAGVFWVTLGKRPTVEHWGGEGFSGTPEHTIAIPQSEEIPLED